MPLHEYKCLECETSFEELYTSFSKVEQEEPTVECPSCGSTEKARQVPTATTFQLKGGGWANSNYASTKRSKRRGGGSAHE